MLYVPGQSVPSYDMVSDSAPHALAIVFCTLCKEAWQSEVHNQESWSDVRRGLSTEMLPKNAGQPVTVVFRAC